MSRRDDAAATTESAIRCAAYVGGEHGRCPNMGLRENDEMIDADGTGRMVWVSWCDFHERWNEAHRAT